MYGMTLHGAKADSSVPYIRSIMHFEPTFLTPFFGMTHAVNILKPFQEHKNYRISLSGKYKEEFERLLAVMNEYQMKQDRIGISRLQLAFADVLYFIYELYTDPTINKFSGASEKEKSVQKIISFIEQNYANDMNLEEMGEQLHFSKSYLAKLFKEVTGFTVFDFIYKRRINEARILFLTNPKRTVTEVCMETGFKHLAHFSRIFKAHTEQTPEEYKRQCRGITVDPVMKM
jgi:AraC-like DNA-binding protein